MRIDYFIKEANDLVTRLVIVKEKGYSKDIMEKENQKLEEENTQIS